MTPASIFKRCFPVVVLTLVSILAYLHASAATRLFASALMARGPSPSHSPRRVASFAAAKTAAPILERNPFDSETGRLDPAPRRGSSTSPNVSVADPLAWPDCQDVVVTIITQSSDPTWSLTTVRGPGDERARARRVGDEVAGKHVAFIGYNPHQLAPSVWLEGNGSFCQSMLFRPAAPAVPTALVLTRGAQENAPDPRIQRLSESELRVDRALVDKTLENPLSTLRSVRVVPAIQDGTVLGLQLFNIRPNTVLAELGLKNGDRLESINGFSLSSAEKALQAYARLSTAQRLNLKLSRQGKPLEISVNII